MSKSDKETNMICPHCGSDITVTTPDEHVAKCLDCGKRFTIAVKKPELDDDDWEDFPVKDKTGNEQDDDFSWTDDWDEEDNNEEEEDFPLIDDEDF